MDILNFIIALLLIILGVFIIQIYEKLNKKGGLTFHLRLAGIGFIMIGIALILDELGLY